MSARHKHFGGAHPAFLRPGAPATVIELERKECSQIFLCTRRIRYLRSSRYEMKHALAASSYECRKYEMLLLERIARLWASQKVGGT